MSNLAVGIYRLAAKITGMALCRHKIVESVYANRGVGRGEVSFGRSDIDLSMILRTPDPISGDGLELYSLYRRVRALRRINPALTHMMVYDAIGIDRWMRTDTFMGSQERRSMLLLAGKPAPMPVVPVRREDAVRWVAFWSDRFFPLAIQQHNRRNLRKMTIEIWKAWAVARGIVAEPDLTLREAQQKARLHPIGSELADAAADPQRAVAFVMKLAGMLHDELLPPIDKLREPIVIRMLMPPRSRWRVLVVLPHPGAALPAAAFEDQSFIVTPELLHLYIHYFSPFLDWNLPPELRRLGFRSPNPNQFVHACLYLGSDSMLRLPGFVRKDAWLPYTIFSVNQYCIPYLRNGEVPPPIPEDTLRSMLEHTPDCAQYYQRDFPQLYRMSLEQSQVLEQLETPGIYPAD